MKRSATILVATLVTAIILAASWQGCAPRKTTGVSRPDKKLSFAERYEAAKYLISTGQLETAASQLKRLEREARTNVQKAMADETRASLHMARREFVSAEKYASRAIRTHPSLASAYKVRAFARKERGDLSGAVEDFRSALVIEPNDTESLRGLADIFVNQNEILEAAKILERFLDVDSLDARAQDAWCGAMASLLGYDRFPIEYLTTLRSSALTRGELAAVLVVELETARIEAEPRSEPSAGKSSDESADSARFSRDGSQTQKHDTLGSSLRVSDCAGFWFAPFVEKAVGLGLLRSYPDGTFGPGDTVRKGILALELYSFLNLHCQDALIATEMPVEKPARGAEGRVEQTPRLDRARVGQRDLHYADVDDSSYLWRPVVAVTELGIMRPVSSEGFGIDSTLGGAEARAIARDLARVMVSYNCVVGH